MRKATLITLVFLAIVVIGYAASAATPPPMTTINVSVVGEDGLVMEGDVWLSVFSPTWQFVSSYRLSGGANQKSFSVGGSGNFYLAVSASEVGYWDYLVVTVPGTPPYAAVNEHITIPLMPYMIRSPVLYSYVEPRDGLTTLMVTGTLEIGAPEARENEVYLLQMSIAASNQISDKSWVHATPFAASKNVVASGGWKRTPVSMIYKFPQGYGGNSFNNGNYTALLQLYDGIIQIPLTNAISAWDDIGTPPKNRPYKRSPY